MAILLESTCMLQILTMLHIGIKFVDPKDAFLYQGEFRII